LPLSIHPQAIPAALAARCAGEQGRYWEYRHAVFEAQARLNAGIWDELARQLSLDVDKFAQCRRDGRQFQALHADAQLAAAYGLVSTPSFVIGRPSKDRIAGKTVSGAQPFETFAEKIDKYLAEPTQAGP
jgi:protein-disulfide isomerase